MTSPPLVLLHVVVLSLAMVMSCASAFSQRLGFLARGADQSLILRCPDEELVVTGSAELAEELNGLVGARVLVHGPLRGGRLVARSYELIEAPDGLSPHIGRLVVDQSGVRLEDEVTATVIRLRSADLHRFKSQHGARIWVTGTVVGPQVLLVANWQVLSTDSASLPQTHRSP